LIISAHRKKDFEVIKDASHMVNFEQPDKWNRLLESVLPENNK
jgi:pimeloyl-ACP methyl ester carboxylesterase